MKKEEVKQVVPDIEPYVPKLRTKTKVHQYELSGKYIQTFESINEASKATETNYSSIHNCVKGKGKMANNFQWKKAE
jgi:hypothetical protein